MREINIELKLKAVQLFLQGDSYDEITAKLNISKGSVVNIVEQFRNGNLHIPSGMTWYVDELRRLAVDIRKQGTNVNQLKVYSKLHEKLMEIGADGNEVIDYIETFQRIAIDAESEGKFVESARELEKMAE